MLWEVEGLEQKLSGISSLAALVLALVLQGLAPAGTWTSQAQLSRPMQIALPGCRFEYDSTTKPATLMCTYTIVYG